METQARFTQYYSQPDDYHFCQDSVIAPILIARDLPTILSENFLALDVCAGCGVMGLELAFHRRDLRRMDFLELQPEFRTHFERNREFSKVGAAGLRDFRFNEMNFARLCEPEFASSYDLIIANPPYFQPDHGSAPSSELRQKARFFTEATLEDLIKGIVNALKPNGRAYLLVKSGEKHGYDALLRVKSIAWNKTVDVIGDVRGTDLVRISP